MEFGQKLLLFFRQLCLPQTFGDEHVKSTHHTVPAKFGTAIGLLIVPSDQALLQMSKSVNYWHLTLQQLYLQGLIVTCVLSNAMDQVGS